MSIFEKWDNSVDVAGLQSDIEEAEKNGGQGNYDEVPVGKYEVKIDKMELKESSKGKPMFYCQFRILTGDFKNSCLFMNQVITEGFQISQVNKFLRSLEVFDAEDIKFEGYGAYNDLILDMMEAVDGYFEFLLEYKKSKKDFPIYKIEDVFEI